MVETPVESARFVMEPLTATHRPEDDLYARAAGHTIPTVSGIINAYRRLEREMFSHPEDAERYAEIMALTRSQLREQALGHRTDQEGRHDRPRVTPLAPTDLQRLVDVGRGHKHPREKSAREVAEDDLLRAGLAPILASLTIPQLDAVRHIHYFRHTLAEAAASLGVHKKTVYERLQRAYANIRTAIPVDGYRRVRAWLIAEGQKDRASRGA